MGFCYTLYDYFHGSLLFHPSARIKVIYAGLLFLAVFFLGELTAVGQEGFRLSGKVNDAEYGQPVELAAIQCEDINRITFSDAKGNFFIEDVPAGKHTLEVHCLGYKTAVFIFDLAGDTVTTILMEKNDLQVKEVVVTAIEKQSGATASEIDGMAMQQIQPSGFADLLEFLPGHISPEKPDMSGVNHIALRQAGTDDNTAFGTSFVIDGIPFSNDAGLQYATNGSSDLKIDGRETVPGGIDMRQLSTDDIESVEIVRGIPSVRHGDVSSGMVLIKRKWGCSPLNLRAKADLNNKLVSLEKGIKLPENKGIINLSTELLSYVNDPRNPLENYTRSTSALKYVRQFDFNGNEMILKTGGSYLFTLDKEKTDPELNYGLKDYYKSDYSRYSFDLISDLYLKGAGAKKLSFKFSAAYTLDRLVRERYVSPTGPMPQPTAMTEGESDASYLPQGYEAHLLVDGKPLNLFSQVDFSISPSGKNIFQTISTGLEWKLDKNYGDGEVYDLTKPLFPATSSGRPRAFKDIPALEKLSGYIEDDLTIRTGLHQLSLQAGLRAAMLPNLDSRYAMHGEIYADPRVNARWTFPAFRFTENLNATLSLRVAWGKLTRLPTLAYLYPAARYFDIIELNYYSQNEDLRRLYVLTRIEDPTNYDLVPTRNTKREAGVDWSLGKTRMAVTFFDEKMTNGILSSTSYVSYTYKAYDASSVSSDGLTAPPDLSLFSYKEKTRLYALQKWTNGSLLNKKGLEYQLTFPRIDKLKTRVTLNGAWFKTRYDITLPEYNKPSYVINGEPYPYAGVYDYDATECQEKQQLNTNIQFDVNIPDYRLLFSLSVQNMWFEKTRQRPFDGLPSGYIDQYGNYHVFTEADRDDPLLSYLVKTYSEHYFDMGKIPQDTRVNLKVSKELGDTMKLSFYVNRIARYAPDYKTRFNTTMRRSSSPYFGMEVRFNL